MSEIGYESKWLRAGRVLEYYIYGGPWAGTDSEAEYQLYHAVMEGEVRARIKGKPVTDFEKIRSRKWSPDKRYALPFDMELNLEDVRRIWDWSRYDVADLLARGLVRPSAAVNETETAILNLKLLLRRVSHRLSAVPLPEAMKEIEFDKRWTELSRNINLYLGSNLIDPDYKSKFVENYELLIQAKEKKIDRPLIGLRKKPLRGRKAIYDWAAAEAHIEKQFEYHGPLSPDDPQWSCQADVEREIQRYFLKTVGREPATSVARQKASDLIKRHTHK